MVAAAAELPTEVDMAVAATAVVVAAAMATLVVPAALPHGGNSIAAATLHRRLIFSFRLARSFIFFFFPVLRDQH